jgi:hypothetical protein
MHFIINYKLVVDKSCCDRVVVVKSAPDGGVRRMVVKHVTEQWYSHFQNVVP